MTTSKNPLVNLAKRVKKLSGSKLITGYIIDAEFMTTSYREGHNDGGNYQSSGSGERSESGNTYINQTWAYARVTLQLPDNSNDIFYISSETTLDNSEIRTGQLVSLTYNKKSHTDTGRRNPLANTVIFHSDKGSDTNAKSHDTWADGVGDGECNEGDFNIDAITRNPWKPKFLTVMFIVFLVSQMVSNPQGTFQEYLIQGMLAAYFLNTVRKRFVAHDVFNNLLMTQTSDFLSYQREILGLAPNEQTNNNAPENQTCADVSPDKATTEDKVKSLASTKEKIASVKQKIISESRLKSESLGPRVKLAVEHHCLNHGDIDQNHLNTFVVADRQVEDTLVTDVNRQSSSQSTSYVSNMWGPDTHNTHTHTEIRIVREVESVATLFVDEGDGHIFQLNLPIEAIKMCDVSDTIIVSARKSTSLESKKQGVYLEYVHNVTKGRTYFTPQSVERLSVPFSADVHPSSAIGFVAFMAFLTFLFIGIFMRSGTAVLYPCFVVACTTWVIYVGLQFYNHFEKNKKLKEVIRLNQSLYNIIGVSNEIKSTTS